MDRFDILFHRELAEAIAKMREPVQVLMTTGSPQDWAAYQRLVGRLEALDGVLHAAEDIRKRLVGENRSAA